jgi:hypothetical protein
MESTWRSLKKAMVGVIWRSQKKATMVTDNTEWRSQRTGIVSTEDTWSSQRTGLVQVTTIWSSHKKATTTWRLHLTGTINPSERTCLFLLETTLNLTIKTLSTLHISFSYSFDRFNLNYNYSLYFL